MTPGLTDFLQDRLDEDEAAARAVEDNSEPWPGQWKADGNHAVRTYNDWVLAYAKDGDFVPGLAAHIARHDPARVLREVEAKRGIIRAEMDRALDHSFLPGYSSVLLDLAAIYSDHPDYAAATAE